MSPLSTPLQDASGALPLHVQVSEMLARDIQAGRYPDGTKLAPERDMAQELGIAVGTLRKALADLTEKGLLERRQGSGNYVRNTQQAQTIYGFFRLELVQGGGLPTAHTLSVDKLPKPDDLPEFGQSSEAFRFRRLRRLNGIDAALEEIWLDASYVDEIVSADLSQSLYKFYRESLNLWITRAEDFVSLAPCPRWRPPDFAAPAQTGQSWGYVERRSFDQNNAVAEFSRTWFDPATTRFVARWK